MEVYVIQEFYPYEGNEIKFVTTDSSKAFEYLYQDIYNKYLLCEIWESDKVVGLIKYNRESEKWELQSNY